MPEVQAVEAATSGSKMQSLEGFGLVPLLVPMGNHRRYQYMMADSQGNLSLKPEENNIYTKYGLQIGI